MTTYNHADTAARVADAAERQLGTMQKLLAQREERLSGLDPDLVPAARMARIHALGEELAKAAGPAETAIGEALQQAQKLAAAVDPRRARLLAPFAQDDPTADATQRIAWTQRAATVSGADDLLELARHIAETGQLAPAGVLEAEAHRRLGAAGISDHERRTLGQVLATVAGVESPDGAATRAAVARTERAFRVSQELLRLLRGARPSATHAISEGLRARQQAAG